MNRALMNRVQALELEVEYLQKRRRNQDREADISPEDSRPAKRLCSKPFEVRSHFKQAQYIYCVVIHKTKSKCG